MSLNSILFRRYVCLVSFLLKLVSHWDATISRLVGDNGLLYKNDFLPFFILRSHWTL